MALFYNIKCLGLRPISTVLRYVEIPMVWGLVWAEKSGLGPPYNLTVHLVLLGGF